MPNATYQIEYRDKDGNKHTVQGVTDIKKTIGPLEGAGDTGFVVLKELPGGGTAAPSDKSNIAAYDAMNGKGTSKDTKAAAPADTSNDAEGAGEPGASPTEDKAEAPVEDNTPAHKKSGKVPAGLAAYIAKKAKS